VGEVCQRLVGLLPQDGVLGHQLTALAEGVRVALPHD
jgi:hypothetical protein